MNGKEVAFSLSRSDLDWMAQTGRSPQIVQAQLQKFITGYPALHIVRPAQVGDGILSFSEEQFPPFLQLFEAHAAQTVGYKFVPASGAASRMFRSLFAYLNDPNQLDEKAQQDLHTFFDQLPHFAFYSALERSLAEQGQSLPQLRAEQQFGPILHQLLSAEGLNYGRLPKALLLFHRYENETRTALQEHLAEAAQYAVSREHQVHLHCTVSPQHLDLIRTHLAEAIPAFEQDSPLQFRVDLSVQNPATDTPTVDMDNQALRDEAGNLIFRPGGHGALLENLNQIEADWVFIKNIDNVATEPWMETTVKWKKLIGGVLVHHQRQVFALLGELDAASDQAFIEQEPQWLSLLQTDLHIGLPPQYASWAVAQRKTYLHRKLNRPIRVCGLIRTEQNTGGGPYWIAGTDGSLSLQILETPQIDLDDPTQQAIAAQAGFANITDLVCGLKDYQGNQFDLLQYRDEETGFITEKSRNGQAIKAQELPGLWNGAMADWITLFVEVPKATFNPVKSVVDLLAEKHRS